MATTSPVTPRATPQWVNVVLGVWLFISAFLWPHSQAQMTNTWLMGLLCVAFAVISNWVPQVRYLNVVLAIWLFISAWALPTIRAGTTWNNVIVAIAIFVVSLLPGSTASTPRIFQGPRPTA